MVGRHDRTVRAVLFRQPFDHCVGLLALLGIDDSDPLARFCLLDRMPSTPAVKDDRHRMTLTLAITGQIPDQPFPHGFHIPAQTPSHPKEVVAVDDEMERHGPRL